MKCLILSREHHVLPPQLLVHGERLCRSQNVTQLGIVRVHHRVQRAHIRFAHAIASAHRSQCSFAPYAHTLYRTACFVPPRVTPLHHALHLIMHDALVHVRVI